MPLKLESTHLICLLFKGRSSQCPLIWVIATPDPLKQNSKPKTSQPQRLFTPEKEGGPTKILGRLQHYNGCFYAWGFISDPWKVLSFCAGTTKSFSKTAKSQCRQWCHTDTLWHLAKKPNSLRIQTAHWFEFQMCSVQQIGQKALSISIPWS
jgi:hypothetical protein